MEHEEEQEVQKIHGGACEFPYFERNNYYHGKFMTVRDFFAEQCYFNQKRWLINRMVNGWGVVCGLDVKKHPRNEMCVIVTPGLAIDCLGREILVCEEQAVSLIPEEPECSDVGEGEYSTREKTLQDKTLVICLEYRECKTETVSLPPQGNCGQKERCEFNRIMDSFRIRTLWKADVCTNDSDKRLCPLDGIKGTGKDPDTGDYQTVHEYLCENLKERCFRCPECPEGPSLLCIVLAEIPVVLEGGKEEGKKQEGCEKQENVRQEDVKQEGEQTVFERWRPDTDRIDPSKRRLVYRNPLLYDLIDCLHGDLPRIIDINWPRPDEGPMRWSWFKEIMTKENEGLKITFDRRMKEATINANTFLFMVKEKDRETGHFQYRCVDDLNIKYDPGSEPGPSVVTLKLNKKWIAEVFRGYSAIQEGAEFLVKLRGDHIMDAENRRALDGNFIGGKLPSGNGVQGGDFVSWFSVEAKEERSRRGAEKSEE